MAALLPPIIWIKWEAIDLPEGAVRDHARRAPARRRRRRPGRTTVNECRPQELTKGWMSTRAVPYINWVRRMNLTRWT